MVHVPQFQIKPALDNSTQSLSMHTPKSIMVDFRFLHPVSKVEIFNRRGIAITSVTL